MHRRSVVTSIALGSAVLGADVFGVAVTAGDAEARLDVYVDKSAQRLSVIKNGELLYVWPASTGRDQFSTPSGVYTPERLERSWVSNAYYNTPMPHAIFFHNGYAIHGSYDIQQLGGPASHGCVRLHPDDAALLFSMVQREGPGNTAIFVGGDSNRPSLRYRVVEVPAQPVLRRDDGVARNAYSPDPVPRSAGPDRYADAYPLPPAGPPMSPYYPGYVDGRAAYPAGPDAAPYYPRRRYAERYDTERYDSGRHDDARSAPHNPRVGSYGDIDGRGAPPGPRLPPDYATDPHIDGRHAPRDPRMPPPDDHYADGGGAPYGLPVPPDYDPYVNGRGAPQGPNPQPYYLPDRQGDRSGERSGDGRAAAEPRNLRVPPYSAADRHGADGRHGDQLAIRGHAPASRPPALRPDGNATGERAPRDGLTAGAKPNPGSNLGARPGADESLGRRLSTSQAPAGQGPTSQAPASQAAASQAPPSQAASAPAPATPAPQPAAASLWPGAPPAARVEPERSQAAVGYRVLPPSYWTGASWRWRTKPDDSGPQEPR